MPSDSALTVTNSVQLRIPFGLGAQLRRVIYPPGSHEYVAFGLVGLAHQGEQDTLLLRELVLLNEEDYRADHRHGASWRGLAMIPAITRAIDHGLGIIILHAHSGSGKPSMSVDDRASAERLIPVFQQRVPRRPHGSIVLSDDHSTGVVWFPGESQPRTEFRLRWYGSSIENWPSLLPLRFVPRPDFLRQLPVTSEDGQRRLADATVAVVGLGGGGSHVVQQLAHLGVGRLLLVDSDRVEKHHRHRLAGIRRSDVYLKRRKTAVMARLARDIGQGTAVERFNELVPAAETLGALCRSDVIVGCVDNLDGRVDLQSIAQRFLIPYVDVGLLIRELKPSDSSSPRVAIGGNVITYIPGGFCQWCIGFLTHERLLADRNNQERGYVQNRPGLAQVVSLNGVLASQAVNEVLQLLTGFAGTVIEPSDYVADLDAGTCPGFKKLDGLRGTLSEWGGIRRLDCEYCDRDLARGVASWG